MALQRISGKEAWEALLQPEGEHGDVWWNRKTRDDSLGKNAMVHRYGAGIVRPGARRRPLLAGQRPVFAIGSCFARRIEDALARAGVPILSSSRVVRQAGLQLFGVSWDFWNKYSTYAILNELRWALEPGDGYPEAALVEIAPGAYWDHHVHLGSSNLKQQLGSNPLTKETLLTFHRALTGVFREIRRAEVIVITLGLNEVWLDQETGLRLNDPASRYAVERHRDRFVLEIPDAETNLANLDAAYALIKRSCVHEPAIVVTVSPVPLLATFTGDDVLVANTLSKSTLRYVAGAWVARHPEIVYFPAYEMVLNSSRDLVWDADQVHVSDPFADLIVQHFLGLFSARPEDPRERLLWQLRTTRLPDARAQQTP